jgi:uncharacterized SAM-binding protein YcdF (DUF218 family)
MKKIIFLAALILIFVYKYDFFLRTFAGFLIVEDKLERADAIVVMAGSPYERALRAAELYKNIYAPKLIACGGQIPDGFEALGLNLRESEITLAALKRLGVPEKAVITMPRGTSTFTEAKIVRDLARQNKMKSIIIVTSQFHTRRARWVYNRVLKGTGIKIMMAAARERRFNWESWWLDDDGILNFCTEYCKFGYYMVKYGF